MSTEDLENYETEMELQLYREYRDIAAQFSYVVETERRFYLTNEVDLKPRNAFGPVRVAITGRRVSPPLFESMELLGRERSLARLAAVTEPN